MILFPQDNYEYNGTGEILDLIMSARKPYVMADVTLLDGSTTNVKLHVDLGSSSNSKRASVLHTEN